MVTVLAIAVGGAWFYHAIVGPLPDDLSNFRSWRPQTSVRVQTADGQQIDSFYVERRTWVDLETLPPILPKAFVSAEDRRFYQHIGVDPLGILRAIVVNVQQGGSSQGASTLTQQLVKNLIVGNERSYERKLKEAVLAYRLEHELTKDQILELYINYVALGSGNYGVEAASKDYFGRSASEIDAGQAALLAGLVPAPSRYSPRRRPEVAAERRRLILRSLVRDGHLTEQEAETYLDDPVLLPRAVKSEDRVGLAYITMVRRRLRDQFGTDRPFDEGFVVQVPLDLEVQAGVEAATRHGLEQHRDRQGVMCDADKPVSTEPLEVGDCGIALVRSRSRLELAGESVPQHAEDRGVLVRPGPDGTPRSLSRAAGMHVPVCMGEDGLRLRKRPWAQGAVVVLEHVTGNVVALSGGYRDALEGYVRATQGRRQPGSAFKPLLYAAALQHGRRQFDRILDGPISFPSGGGRTWSPKNYSGGYAGQVTLRRALSSSLNTPAVRLALEVGVDEVAEVARRLGVDSPIRQDLTMALGSSEATPMDMAVAYSSIAQLGRRVEPRWFDRIEDVHGDLVVLDQGDADEVVEPGVAYELVDMLEAVVSEGTARRAFDPERFQAGKTGTTNDYRDAWFVGFTPRYTVAVWVGTDGVLSLGDRESGGRTALPIWREVVGLLDDGEVDAIPVPADTVFTEVSGRWRPTRRAM